jgi:30S ribosomal protein S31
MGKGDKRTKRGKISAGSFGKTRPKKKNIKKAAAEAVQNNKAENKA